MRAALVLALIGSAALAQGRVYDRTCQVPSRRSTRGGVACSLDAGVVAVDGGVIDLNGYAIPLALQCTGAQPFTESPRQAIVFARASSAYCTKSDGTVTLVSTDVPRRERQGLLIEPSAANAIGANGADARDLSVVGYTKTNMTCVKNAVGVDGVAASASTCTATGSNATVTYAVTVGSSKRASSMYLRAVTVTGAVSVTRNNFSTATDVSASLSTSTNKRVISNCGGGGDDLNFSTIDNCIAASNMTSTAANPVIGLKLANSGDSVVIDFVQDEATDWATSPMSGFARAIDRPSVTLNGSLPVAQGEISIDWTSQRSTGDDPADFVIALRTKPLSASGGVMLWSDMNTGGTGAYISNSATGSTTLGPTTGDNIAAGQARNQRVTWGGTSASSIEDGRVLALSSSSNIPDTHTGPYTLGEFNSDDTDSLGGWMTRVRWTSGTFSSFKGSALTTYLIGDSIVLAAAAAEGSEPQQVFSSLLGGGRALDRYVKNYGVNGQLIDGCITSFRARVDDAILRSQKAQTVVVMQCGQNSEGDGAPAVFAKIKAAVNDAIDAGVKAIPSTVTPYVDKFWFVDELNADIRAWSSDAGIQYAESFRPLESPPDSGICGYCIDGQHVSAAGSVIESTAWFNAGRAAGFY